MRRAAVIGGALVLGGAAVVAGLAAPGLLGRGDGAPAEAGEAAAAAPGDRLAAGDLAGARALYLAAVEADPDDLSAQLGLATVAVLSGDPAEAERRAGEVGRLGPGSPEARAARAAATLAAGGPAEPAATEARAAVEARPDLLIARWALAQALVSGGEPCSALPVLDSAIAAKPGVFALRQMRLYAFNRAGDWDAHHLELQRLHERFPDRSDVAEWLFESYEGRGDVAGAAGVLRDLAEAGDGPEPALRLVDYLRRSQGDAAADAELARLAGAEDDPPTASALTVALARSLSDQGRIDEAVETLRPVAGSEELDPVLVNGARVALAQAFRAQGDTAAARGELDAVLVDDPGNTAALTARAALLMEEGRPLDAVLDLVTAQAQDPSDTAILLQSARAYNLAGSEALAGDTLARAVEISNGGAAEVEAYADFLRARGQDRAADRLVEEMAAGPPAPASEPDATAAAGSEAEAEPVVAVAGGRCTG